MKGVAVDDPEKPISRKPEDKEPLAALAFKIKSDKFVGRLTFLRIYRCTPDWPRTPLVHHATSIPA